MLFAYVISDQASFPSTDGFSLSQAAIMMVVVMSDDTFRGK